MKLYCIPYAGGGPEAFRGWQEAMGNAVDVRVFDLPGRGERYGDPLIRSMPRLVDELVDQCGDWDGTPYSILGYSFGAVVGYSLTLALETLGRGPCRLFVGGARAPFLPPNRPPFHTLPDDALIKTLREMGGTPNEILENHEIMAFFLPIIRADFEVLETYDARRQKVRCPLSIFGGDLDPFVSHSDLSPWSTLTVSDADQQVFPGGHFILQSQRSAICRAVRSRLVLEAQVAETVAAAEVRL